MHNHSVEFISFLKQYTTIVVIKESQFGLQLDFKHQSQVKSIFFHYILPDHTSNLSNLNKSWIIWEDLWISKTSIVQASIRAYFGKNKTIHGRKTTIQSVSTPEAKTFLTNNHLFSPSTGKFRLGLYFEQQLVGLMTFSTGRNWKEREGKSFEIIRFCNHKDYRIHGGFSKLLKTFITQKNPVQLMTYADASWYHSTMYEQFGFKATQRKISEFWISSINYERKISLNNSDHSSEWMKVVNYESYKFTWES